MGDPNPASNIRRCVVRRMPRVLLGACGCNDAVKFGVLYQHFSKWAKVDVVFTRSSIPFINATEIPHLVANGDRTSAHQYLEWADVMVIAPLSANTLAKIARGLSDNILTEIVRRWNPNKPIYVAPSVDVITWNNPSTEQHRKICVDQLGINIIEPSKMGEMAEPSEISYTVKISNDEIWDYVYC